MGAKVIEVLQHAANQDPKIFKPAEQTLKEWETQRGFYTTLFNVYSDQSFPTNVRWIAVLCLKNGVDRYWRRNAPNEIAASEKDFLRQGLISTFDEPVNQLAIQIAVLIAKIARYDCPKEWSSLVPMLLEAIRGSNPLTQHRALLTLHHVVKTLASKRLPPDNRYFEELTKNIFGFILNLWNTFTESFLILSSNGAEVPQIQEALEKALLSLRILRKCIIYGFNKPSQSQDAMMFLKVVFERARTSLECRKNLIFRGIQLDVCDKFIIHLTKILIGALSTHPLCYVELIPTTLEFSVYYCFTEAGQALTFERFIIQCLNLIKGILMSNQYRLKGSEGKGEKEKQQQRQANQLRQEFFTAEVLKEVCTRLVTHYFLLTPSDLELWDSLPENCGIDDNESWKYNLKPCTESLFMSLFHQFKEVSSMVLVDLMQRHHQFVDPNDLHGILLKDAVYNAVGLVAFDLYDEVNFDQWFSTTLKQELKERSNNYRIIRRRVCWLIGKWIRVKLCAELRPELYKLMVESLSIEEDLGVRLTASETLKVALDDFMFNLEDFASYIEPAFSLLFTLFKEVTEFDNKMRVLNVLSFMIGRIGNDIKPHVSELITYLPVLWQQSDEHNMLRCAIVSTLVHLERALVPDGAILQSLVVSVVAMSCDMNQYSHVYLLEDGLELWVALLENAPASTPAIMELFANMSLILDSSTENLKRCLDIIEAYVLLNPQEFLSKSGPEVVSSLSSLLGDLRSEGIVMAMGVFETCIRVAPQQGSQIIKPLLTRVFENVYKEDDCPTVMTMYLSILARVLLYSRDIFVEVIRVLVTQIGGDTNEETVLGEIVRVWVKRMPLVFQAKQRKLLALALCSLLGANSPPTVLQHFHLIISNIVETLNDIMKLNAETGFCSDSLMIDELTLCEDYETEHHRRKEKLEYTDPIYYISLKEMFQDQLIRLRNLVGTSQFDGMMLTVNSEIKQQLVDYITL